MTNGKYIVLEGPEGVGKTTQALELVRRLQLAGLPVRALREPDSQSDLTARTLRQLTQDPQYPMNTVTEVLLYNAARSQSLQVIKRSLEQGIICVVDRNYLTTLAIQYYGRGDVPDYGVITKIIDFAVDGVEPDLCIVMDAPVQTLKERAKFRGRGERFDNLDEAFLERVRAGYLWEAKQRDLPVIFATADQATVAEAIWKLVAETLAVRGSKKPAAATEPMSLKQIIAQKSPLALPHEPPLNATISTAPASAASPNHLELGEVTQMLASDLRAHALVISDDTAANNTYFTPPQLDAKLQDEYCQKLTTIFGLHAELLAAVTAHLQTNQGTDLNTANSLNHQAASSCQAVLPLAAQVSAHVTTTATGVSPVLRALADTKLQEAEALTRQLAPNEPIISPKTAELQSLASHYLPDTHTAGDPESVTLVELSPKIELSLVPDMLFASSNLPLNDIRALVDGWSYQQKTDVFTNYLLENPAGTVLHKVGYSWDIVSDFTTYRALQGAAPASSFSRQLLTPRYGYDTPEVIDEAGLSDQYEQCFSLSLELYSLLQAAGHTDIAQYAVLLGHKLRYQLTLTAEAIYRLLLQSSSPELQPIIAHMRSKLAEVHPLLSEALLASHDQSASLDASAERS